MVQLPSHVISFSRHVNFLILTSFNMLLSSIREGYNFPSMSIYMEHLIVSTWVSIISFCV